MFNQPRLVSLWVVFVKVGFAIEFSEIVGMRCLDSMLFVCLHVQKFWLLNAFNHSVNRPPCSTGWRFRSECTMVARQSLATELTFPGHFRPSEKAALPFASCLTVSRPLNIPDDNRNRSNMVGKWRGIMIGCTALWWSKSSVYPFEWCYYRCTWWDLYKTGQGVKRLPQPLEGHCRLYFPRSAVAFPARTRQLFQPIIKEAKVYKIHLWGFDCGIF